MGLPAIESNGSSERTEALYREHGAAIAAFCRSLLRDGAEAEDAAQQVFLSAHRALLNGAAPREPLAWLLAVARHECYARFRRRAAAPLPAGAAPEGATPDASVHALRAGEMARVWDELGRMPAAQREAFLLREIRGLSYGQLADELSLSRPSVRSLLLRARTRLRNRLGDVATALGGVPWVQSLLRLFLGGDATSTVPVATKAVVVGLGAAALAGGANVPGVARHAARTGGGHAVTRHRATERAHRAFAPHAIAVVTRRGDRSGGVEWTSRHSDGSRDSDSGGSGARDGGGDDPQVAAPVVVQPTTSSSGSDGGGGSSSGPGPGDSSSVADGGSSSGPGPDTATTTISDSSGPGPTGDGGGSDGSGSGSGSTDDGSGGHGG